MLIWSTGFVVARYGMPHAPPLGFIAWRHGLSLVAFGLWILVSRPAWPRGAAQWFHLGVTGVLLHAGYLGGVWAAVKEGMSAGTIALIVGLQPVLTAVWVSATGAEHRVSASRWLGLALGLAGLLLVVWRKLDVGEITAFNLALGLLALASITTGTLYQKRFVLACDVRTANTVQLLAAFAVAAVLARLEHEPIRWHPELIGAMAWSVLVLTMGGSSLYPPHPARRGHARDEPPLPRAALHAVLAWVLFRRGALRARDSRAGAHGAGRLARGAAHHRF